MRKEVFVAGAVIVMFILSLMYGCVGFEEEYAGQAYMNLQRAKQSEYKSCYETECAQYAPKSLNHRACLRSCLDAVREVPPEERDIPVEIVEEVVEELPPKPEQVVPVSPARNIPLVEQIVLEDDELPEGFVLVDVSGAEQDITNPGYLSLDNLAEIFNREDIEGVEAMYLVIYELPEESHFEMTLIGLQFASAVILDEQLIKLFSFAINQGEERFT
ncbi:hypothetical protein KY362_02995, partial [Candidatus Woesearchaeota archaeon]|nr:hypothetical protein [Candidatus Woesearchaeota archaeon]